MKNLKDNLINKINMENIEIQFKGKSVDTNKWVYGGYHTDGTHTTVIIHKQGINLSHNSEVLNDSVCQYTGLKDKNNNKIFERDILFDVERNNFYKVFRVGGGFAINTHQDDLHKEFIQFYTGLSEPQMASFISQLEVVGNSYDNKDLLTKFKKS